MNVYNTKQPVLIDNTASEWMLKYKYKSSHDDLFIVVTQFGTCLHYLFMFIQIINLLT